MRRKIEEKAHGFVQCLHGNRLPVFSMHEGNKIISYADPIVRFTISLIDHNDKYCFGISFVFKTKDQYSKKHGRKVSEGRAISNPFFEVDKKDFTKKEVRELLFGLGYKVGTASKTCIRNWQEHDFSAIYANKFMKDIVLDSGRVIEIKDTRNW